ncbi:2-hydroxyacid dehydrogenase (plasmid) [Sinorhizobium numidicum]|uniref:2-hydroxyacid dehydrogenase n=1 Tax=Sinorhizobium numidicum TaxID=680248 RepID=A0ABY8D4B2_9HYPH|nr:2-hydroxyacid dehydrogenase [Sinorhizobium numidicum]WEX79735.1 2-hydroxyacid dehydrogenase [Sinorhizobium numidicum]WEX85699.1 2-hydroxyacid dehydrogenase [Sinorhizobium numidicum]
MTKPDILLMGPYPDWDLAELEERYQVHKIYSAANREAFLAQHAPNIRAIATRGELGASAELMRSLPKLEIVSCYGVGTDAIDLAHAKANGIRVTNTPDVLTADVADFGVALLLAAARQIPKGDAYVRDGHWATGNMGLVTRVCGKKVGIVGMGRIGSAVAKRLAGFDCEISYFDINRRADLHYSFVPDLTELARRSEFLIVTLAGGESTRGIVDAPVLAALGANGILVNISRGSTVDESALIDALERRTIKAAALDVFASEPNIDRRFLALDNVVLQPHHASGTVETRQAMGQLVRDNLAAHFAGQPLITPVV